MKCDIQSKLNRSKFIKHIRGKQCVKVADVRPLHVYFKGIGNQILVCLINDCWQNGNSKRWYGKSGWLRGQGCATHLQNITVQWIEMLCNYNTWLHQ